MKKTLILVTGILILTGCISEERKWMIIIDTGMNCPNDTIYTTGDHIDKYGWKEIKVYKTTGPNLHPDEVYNNVILAKEITE